MAEMHFLLRPPLSYHAPLLRSGSTDRNGTCKFQAKKLFVFYPKSRQANVHFAARTFMSLHSGSDIIFSTCHQYSCTNDSRDKSRRSLEQIIDFFHFMPKFLMKSTLLEKEALTNNFEIVKESVKI